MGTRDDEYDYLFKGKPHRQIRIPFCISFATFCGQWTFATYTHAYRSSVHVPHTRTRTHTQRTNLHILPCTYVRVYVSPQCSYTYCVVFMYDFNPRTYVSLPVYICVCLKSTIVTRQKIPIWICNVVIGYVLIINHTMWVFMIGKRVTITFHLKSPPLCIRRW